jgi:hypothetical protein
MAKESVRLRGHILVSEGAAMDDRGYRVGSYRTTGGTGRARCGCGVLSEVFDSATKRKAWHRGHKATVRAESEQER